MQETFSPLLRDVACDAGPSTVAQYGPNIIAYPNHWQEPAATERAAYESVAKSSAEHDFTYLAFPWATLIDSLREHSPLAGILLEALRSLKALRSRGRLATVAQHIYTSRYIELITSCGVTDLFWSHAQTTTEGHSGLVVHPFPLYPAQAPIGEQNSVNSTSPRKYLANFIGAYNPAIYISGVRACIFKDAGRYSDLLIIQRSRWHFDNAVYDIQLHKRQAGSVQSQRENIEALEYISAIQQSWFTLCPTGSGPNSIRIYEALALGSIPIILTQSLRLAGPASLWNASAIIEADSAEGYTRAMAKARALTAHQKHSMLCAGQSLFAHIAPNNYSRLIIATIENASSANASPEHSVKNT